jgi:predicted aspartyl protease
VPSFTSQLPDLHRTGPVCQVRIGVSQPTADLLRQQGKPIPTPVEITALIDTGASGTTVKPEVIRQLQLTPRGVTNICTPSSSAHPCNVYDVSLVFPNGIGVSVITVIEVPLEGQVIQGLIGRDVLAHGILIYSGYTNTFSLSF